MILTGVAGEVMSITTVTDPAVVGASQNGRPSRGKSVTAHASRGGMHPVNWLLLSRRSRRLARPPSTDGISRVNRFSPRCSFSRLVKLPSSAGISPYALARQDNRVKTLVGRYYSRISQVHDQCFYKGRCASEDTERRIRETAEYIRDAENLAYGNLSGT